MSNQITQLRLLVQKDLRCLFRAKQIPVSVLGFSLLLSVVASFSMRQVGFAQSDLLAITPGILWIEYLFCAVLALNFSFSVEEESLAIHGLLCSQVDAGLVFLSKWFSNLVFLLLIQVVILVAHALFFQVDLFSVFPELLFISALFGIGFIAIGTLFSGVAACSRAKEILLPLMLFPLCLPEILAAIGLAREVLSVGVLPTGNFWFLLLCGFDCIALVLSWALFEHVVRG